jgi:hypothetical protein
MSDMSGGAESSDEALLNRYPEKCPQGQLIWTALVEVGGTQDLGPSPKGHRYMVPILGGRVIAGPAGAGLAGEVLPGGADRQLLRADGVKELDAIYEMQTEDGVVLSIRNRVLVDPKHTPDRYALSVIEVTAPEGRLQWLNRRVIMGTLDSARPQQPIVIIRAWGMGLS